MTKLSVFLITCFMSLSAYAQRDLPSASSPFSRHSVFLELGGNALAYSINYDYRLLEHVSARAGLGYFGLSQGGGNGSVLFVPLMVNYLTGTGSSHFEIGAGPVFSSIGGKFINFDRSYSGVLGITSTIGYRLQPRDGGFHFRIGLTPVFAAGFFLPWLGISFGYSF